MTHKEDKMKRLIVALGFMLLTVPVVHAKLTPEQQCEKGRYHAAAKYAQCQFTAFGNDLSGASDFTAFQAALSKCRATYANAWTALEKKAAGTGALCDSARFVVNITDGSITDKLTGLSWEPKSSFNVSIAYTWANSLNDIDMVIHATGEGDWRLPTPSELSSIVSESYPCSTSPCIDPIFGPTGGSYWTSVQVAIDPTLVWFVNFTAGGTDNTNVTQMLEVRAVRGGL
jgi:hypothetical protein